MATLLEGLNRTLTGWATYLRHGAAKRTFNTVDHHTWHRLRSGSAANTASPAAS
ncbi:group II intron maturase-specific domain-containing protein [Streptomyces sp. NPDC005374]|uniref:group II intron maturase-specific domain-containing protein n=1 Tax=Streptomyces sp. NPDC005374 TaxID=3364713 RepID=UPI00369A1E6B